MSDERAFDVLQARLVVAVLLRGLLAQRLDERGHVPPVLGRQLVDAGDQEVPLLAARLARLGRPAGGVRQATGTGGGAAAARGSALGRGCRPSPAAGRRGGPRRRRTASAPGAAAGSGAAGGWRC